MSGPNLGRLLMDMKESLERQMQVLQHEMREGFAAVNRRFDTQAARIYRQARSSKPEAAGPRR